MARPICLRLLAQLARAAASRTFWTAGRRSPIRMAMIAITTSSSIRVKASRRGIRFIVEFSVKGRGVAVAASTKAAGGLRLRGRVLRLLRRSGQNAALLRRQPTSDEQQVAFEKRTGHQTSPGAKYDRHHQHGRDMKSIGRGGNGRAQKATFPIDLVQILILEDFRLGELAS